MSMNNERSINSNERSMTRNKYTKESFINRSILLYGNKFNYNAVDDNIRFNSKIELYCNTCKEEFTIIAYRHFKIKSGCLICSRKAMYNKRSNLTIDDFIERSRIVHKDKYNYDYIDVSNIKYKSKVELYCNQCDLLFAQRVDSHLSGSGCPVCSKKLHNWRNI